MSDLKAIIQQIKSVSAACMDQISKYLQVDGIRRFPLNTHIITLDEEQEFFNYFQNNDYWPRASKTNPPKPYTRKEIEQYIDKITHVSSKNQKSSFSNDPVQKKRAEELDLYKTTYVVPLMEQLIEFDFLCAHGVKVLSQWT